MRPKYALVTGVSRRLGLGFAVARQLAELDYHVILTARDIRQAKSLLLSCGGKAILQRPKPRSGRSDQHQRSCTAADSNLRASGCAGEQCEPFSRLPHTFSTRRGSGCVTRGLRSECVWVLGADPGFTAAAAACSCGSHRQRLERCRAADRKAQHRPIFSPAHSLSKYTLNALTRTLAPALAGTPILVNAVDPGRVATHPERGDDDEDRSPAEAANGVVWAATLDKDGPTGGLFFDGKP